MSDAVRSDRRLDNLATIIRIVAWLALLVVVLFIALGPFYRLGVVSLELLFTMLKTVFTPALLVLGGISVVFTLVAFVTGYPRSGALALLAGAAALGSGAVPILMKQKADAVPMIHDITTDSIHPPIFVAVAPLREAAPNPVTYDPADGEKQRAAYEGLETGYFPDHSYEEVFEAARATLESMGLDIVAVEENAGRIEATATSRWFGFKDDVSVSVNRFSEIVELDIRSKSRVGKSDLGVNADRIERFLARLDDALPAKAASGEADTTDTTDTEPDSAVIGNGEDIAAGAADPSADGVTEEEAPQSAQEQAGGGSDENPADQATDDSAAEDPAADGSAEDGPDKD